MSCYLELSFACGCSYIKKAAPQSPQAATVHRDYREKFGIALSNAAPCIPGVCRVLQLQEEENQVCLHLRTDPVKFN